MAGKLAELLHSRTSWQEEATRIVLIIIIDIIVIIIIIDYIIIIITC